jgi:hypothetical protein
MHARARLSFGRVLLAQMRLLRSARYLYALIGVLAVGLLVLRTVQPPIDYDRPVWAQEPRLPAIMPFLILFGCGAALLNWIVEPPSRRRYHRSLPVVHAVHDAARVVAGLLWLLIALALFCVAGALTENAALFHEWLRDVPELWAAFLGIPVVTYLLCSIFAVAFDVPVAWIAGIVSVALLLDTKTVKNHVPEATDLIDAVVSPQSPYTLGQAIGGWDDAWRVGVPIKDYSHWWSWKRSQEFQQWRNALLIWYLLALCGLTLAVKRKPVG